MTTFALTRRAGFAGIAALALTAAFAPAFAAEITGAGATFPFPIYSKWADDYKKQTGNGLNYQSIGSGAGIKQIQARTVTFGASDMPLKAAQLTKDGLVQWPQVMGALVPVVNLEGVKPGELVLDGGVLADIYLGKIKTWSDPAIAKLNPGIKLPADAITVVRRSDGSGTTFLWTNYLSKVSPDWKAKAGEGTAVEWPAGVGAKGNEGVAGNVAQTKNAIGYVEYAYAKQNKLTHTALINAAGKTIQPTMAAFQAAAANADWTKEPNFYQILTNQAGDASWPITGATFVLMPAAPQNKADAAEALKFFAWAFENGAKTAEELDYIPMPENVVKQVRAMWDKDISSK